MLSCLFLAALWTSARKALTSCLLCVVFSCVLPLSYLCSQSDVVLDCSVSLSLPYLSTLKGEEANF